MNEYKEAIICGLISSVCAILRQITRNEIKISIIVKEIICGFFLGVVSFFFCDHYKKSESMQLVTVMICGFFSREIIALIDHRIKTIIDKKIKK